MAPELVNRIEGLLRLDWSPELISGWLLEESGVRISHERIYQHVWEDRAIDGDLYRYPRRCGKPYRRRGRNGGTRSRITGRIGIEQRPEIVVEHD